MLGVGQCALSPFSAAAVFPRILRSPALLALRVLLPLLLIQLDRFHHGLSGMAELRDVSRYRGEFFQLIACRQRTSLGGAALGGGNCGTTREGEVDLVRPLKAGFDDAYRILAQRQAPC